VTNAGCDWVVVWTYGKTQIDSDDPLNLVAFPEITELYPLIL
jgi:hypothetical protein